MKINSFSVLSFMVAMLPTLSSADTIDVGVVLDQNVINAHGREWVDQQLKTALKTSNAVLTFSGVDHRREIRNVITVDENNPVATATLGSGGALSGAKAVCEVIKDNERFAHFDNVLWLVPESGNSNRIGNTSYCIDGDHNVAVVALNYPGNVGHLIAHEFGHHDGLKHSSADEVYAQTGEVRLMSNYLYQGLSNESNLVTDDDVATLIYSDTVANDWPKMFSHPRPDWPSPIGTASFDVQSTRVDIESGTVELMLKLDKPLSEKSSIEFYTEEVTAKPKVDYKENITRLDFLAGQNEVAVEVELVADAKRYESKNFLVGVRYGDVITGNQTMSLELDANANQGEIDLPTPTAPDIGGSSGGSGGSLNWFVIVVMMLTTTSRLRRK